MTDHIDTLVLPNELLLGEVSALLAEGKSVVLKTKGNSMLPLIRGDRDSVELHREDSVRENDIVLARLTGGQYVLHRVIAIDGENVTLMGDGNIRGTEHCRLGDICGTALFVVRTDDTKVDVRSAGALRRASMWRRLLPVRRYILGVYRRVLGIS